MCLQMHPSAEIEVSNLKFVNYSLVEHKSMKGFMFSNDLDIRTLKALVRPQLSPLLCP